MSSLHSFQILCVFFAASFRKLLIKNENLCQNKLVILFWYKYTAKGQLLIVNQHRKLLLKDFEELKKQTNDQN